MPWHHRTPFHVLFLLKLFHPLLIRMKLSVFLHPTIYAHFGVFRLNPGTHTQSTYTVLREWNVLYGLSRKAWLCMRSSDVTLITFSHAQCQCICWPHKITMNNIISHIHLRWGDFLFELLELHFISNQWIWADLPLYKGYTMLGLLCLHALQTKTHEMTSYYCLLSSAALLLCAHYKYITK